MNVTLVAMNAMYSHTSLSLRLLTKAVEGLPIRHTPLELHINMREDAMLRSIYETKPDVLCFSCYIWNIRAIIPLFRRVKRLLPEIRLVLGGPEVGYAPFAYLSEHPQVDAIVCGEGEISYRLLLMSYLEGGSGQGIPGVCVASTHSSALSFGETVSLPDMLCAYTSVECYDSSRIWYAETSRGCPFSCRFCLSSVSPGVRALTAAESVTLLRSMADHGAKLVKLVDRTFNFDPRRAIEIWKGLLDTTGDCVFHFEIEPNLLNEETLLFLKNVPKGKFQFEIGIQSTHTETLQHISRRLNHDSVKAMLLALGRPGNIALHLDLIAGLPHESFHSFSKSFNDVFEMEPTVLQVGFLKLLRGASLRRDAAKYGIVYAEDAPYEVLRTDFLHYDELLRLKDIAKIVDWYYNANQCPATIALLLRSGAPFDIFKSIADRLRAVGLLDAPISQAKRFEALLAAGLQLLPQKDANYLYETIRFDALLRGLPLSQIPGGCRKDSPDEKKRMRKEYPQYHQSREYHVTRFRVDIAMLLQKKLLIERDVTLCIQPAKAAYRELIKPRHEEGQPAGFNTI